jgi:hypothetical protein
MQHIESIPALVVSLSVLLGVGCHGGVGDPCTPEDEYNPYFSGFSAAEINIETRSLQCETRLCLVNHFQGRVTCPYGQTADMLSGAAQTSERQYCHTPGSSERVQMPVASQLTARRARDSVYCSCRCDGPNPGVSYCRCPSGFVCTELLTRIDELGSEELAGSYCVKSGTVFEVRELVGECSVADPEAEPPGNCGSFSGE